MPQPTFFVVSLTALISLFFYKKFKNTIYKYFLFYLWYTFLTELLYTVVIMYYYEKNILLFSTYLIYNIYAIVTFVFYILFYKKLFRKLNNKRFTSIFLIIYLIFIPIDLFLLKTNFINDFFVNNIVFGSILIIITLILFLIEIINDENIVFNIKKTFIFWISVGVLLFYIGVTPIIIGSNYLNFGNLYQKIIIGLNVIMYGSFILGFIWADKKYNY